MLTQSLAIIEYLEETWPEPHLLPPDAETRAHAPAHSRWPSPPMPGPSTTCVVPRYLKRTLGQDQPAIDAWYRHWSDGGLKACEALLPAARHTFCFGEEPTLADIVLVPQLYNARLFRTDLSDVPRLVGIDAACCALPAFAKAAPEAQPDAV